MFVREHTDVTVADLPTQVVHVPVFAKVPVCTEASTNTDSTTTDTGTQTSTTQQTPPESTVNHNNTPGPPNSDQQHPPTGTEGN